MTKFSRRETLKSYNKRENWFSCGYYRQHSFHYLRMQSPLTPHGCNTTWNNTYARSEKVQHSWLLGCRCTEGERKHYRRTWQEQLARAIKLWVYKHIFGMNLYRVCAEHLAHQEETPLFYVCTSTDMRRLTKGIRSEKCVFRRFRRCANVYLNKPRQYSIAYYTPRLYGIDYCF